MKVWIVQSGQYDNSIEGVYATREAAIAAFPLPSEERRLPPREGFTRPGGWQPDDPQNPENGFWWNGLYWHESATIRPEEVKE